MAEADVEWAWNEQSKWSQVANLLKRDLERKRAWALGLAIAAAILSSVAVAIGLRSAGGKACAFASAGTISLIGLLRGRSGRKSLQDWTRARSVSEAIKSEVYLFLAGVGDAGFEARVRAIEDDGRDLLDHLNAVAPVGRTLPAVHDIASYLAVRVGGQIEGYYRPRAAAQSRKARTARRVEVALAATGAVLGAAAGTWEQESLAIWVPVVTTIAAAVTAHVAEARYEFLVIEYLRTAEELERVRDRRGPAATMTDEELVRRAESVISIQNEGWMAKLTSEAAPDG